jgi:hypothetical protein
MDIRIELTIIGDVLINKELQDENQPLNVHTNRHEHCGGFFHKHSVSKTHDRHTCDRCGFSFTINKDIDTHSKLRAHIKKHGHFPE